MDLARHVRSSALLARYNARGAGRLRHRAWLRNRNRSFPRKIPEAKLDAYNRVTRLSTSCGCVTKREILMARKDSRPEVSRRKFLAGVAVTGAAATLPSALPPTAHQIATETGIPKDMPHLAGRAGSDFMVDVIKSLKIDYVYSNPASSFRGLHESLINYGKNSAPEFITCTHEESSVAMAHGYAKVTGKPQMVLCHGTVGLQHAAMAVYNAWCDRAPIIIVGGNDLDAAKRPPGVPTFHSAQDINALVRDSTKWDDTPVSLQHFAQSFVRAYKNAMTPHYEPVAISLDAGLQQEPNKAHNGEKLYIPKYT